MWQISKKEKNILSMLIRSPFNPDFYVNFLLKQNNHKIINNILVITSTVILINILISNVYAASLLVTPTRIEISYEKNSSESIKITNQANSSIVLQARAYDWKDSIIINNDQDSTKDLIVLPSVFSLEPNSSQIIRMALRSPITEPLERAYRLIISEVLDDRIRHSSGVRVLLRLSIPIFALADDAFPDPMWDIKSSNGNDIITFFNKGTSHIHITKINIYINNKDKSLLQTIEQPFDVIAGGHKDLILSRQVRERLWVDVESNFGPLSADIAPPR